MDSTSDNTTSRAPISVDVFVSYAAHDRERVRPMVDALTGTGLNVWWDRRIAPGAGFDAEIQQALDAARCVLVVWSKESINSEWVITEASEGLERGVLVPVSIDDVRPPLAFRRRQTIESANSRTASEDVVAAVQGVLNGENVEIRAKPQRGRRAAPWIGLAAGMILGLAGDLTARQTMLVDDEALPPPAIRVPLELDGWDEWKTISNSAPSIAMSPDGNAVVFVSRDTSGTLMLAIRQLDQLATTKLAGTEGASNPFLSPDGRWVGYFDDGQLKRIATGGGEPSTIVSVTEPDSWGASWGADDQIVYSVGRSGLKSVSIRGADARTLTQLDASRGEGSHRLPQHVRGHPLLLFTVYIDQGQTSEVWALNLATGERRYLFDGQAAAYVATGHIIYAKGESVIQGSLWSVPFDPDRIAVTGTARMIQSAVAGNGGSAYAVAHSGPLLYLPAQGELHGELILRESDGTSRVLAHGLFEAPKFSNDGRYVAAEQFRGTQVAIWIYQIGTGASRRFAESGFFPLWDPDDRALTFLQMGTGIVRQRLEDPTSRETLVAHERVGGPNAWVHGGKSLLYGLVNPQTVGDTYLLEPGREVRHIYGRGAAFGSVTADEQWLALCTWPKGVLVGHFPDFSSVTIASDQGCTPTWSTDQTKLYFQDFDKLWAVNVDIGSGISFGKREIIVDLGMPGRDLYDVDRSGRIVVARHTFSAPKPPVLTVNWANASQ